MLKNMHDRSENRFGRSHLLAADCSRSPIRTVGLRFRSGGRRKIFISRVLAVFCAALLAAGSCSVPAAATNAKSVTVKVDKANKKFKVRTEAGLDGTGLYDRPNLVKVTVECSENFTGSVRLYSEVDYGRKVVAYGADISLAAGQPKTFSFVLQEISAAGSVKVEILNEKDQVIYGESDLVEMRGAEDKALVGILSDDFGALNYFDGIPYPVMSSDTTVSVLQMSQEDFDGDSTALSALSYIVIDNYDTARLSDEQYGVLQDWVNSGGNLILSLGANCQNVMHGLKGRLFDAETGNLEKQDITYLVNEKMLEGDSILLPKAEQSIDLEKAADGEGQDKESADKTESDSTEDTDKTDSGSAETVDDTEKISDGGVEQDVSGAADEPAPAGDTDKASQDGTGDEDEMNADSDGDTDIADPDVTDKPDEMDDGSDGVADEDSDEDLSWVEEAPDSFPSQIAISEKALNELWSNGRLTLTDVDAVPLTIENGIELKAFSDDGLLWLKHIGAGNVILVTYALGMEPVAGYSERALMAEALLTSIGMTAGSSLSSDQSGYTINAGDGERLAKLADQTKKPSVILYGGLLLLYVVIVGPVLYLVLKVRKKREQLWTAIPVTAMIFTGIIYVTGFLYRVRVPIVNTVSLVKVDDHVQREEVYANVVTPRAKDSSVLIDPSFSRVRPAGDDYSYNVWSTLGNGEDKQGFDYLILKTNEGTELKFHNKEAFSENAFVVSKSSDNQTGQFELDLTCTTTGFEGKVTNQTKYDLKNVVLNFETYYYTVGDMKAGETVEVDPADMLSTTGSYVNMVYDSWNSQLGKENSRNYSVDSAITENITLSEAYNTGYVWGIIDHYDSGLCKSGSVKKNGYGVLLQRYESDYSDMTGLYYPDLKTMIVSDQGDYDSSDGMMYAEDVTITYSFEGYPGITSLELVSTDEMLSSQKGYGSYAEVYAYNVETGNYDRIFEDDRVLSGKELEKYMLGDILMLRYHTDEVYEGFIPRIAAKGDK